jgi:cytochrome c oxidase subunit 2
MAVLALALWRRRAERNDPLALQPRTERRMGQIIAVAMAATVVIISGFTLASFVTTRAMSRTGGDGMTIRVRGLQWWWEVEYRYADGAGQGFTTANEIHIPTGRDVHLQLEGGDVIHSFWVPNLAGKLDLIPGRINELTLRAERPGIYRGQCAEFCGLQHAHMAFLVVAQAPADFEQWCDEQRRNASAPTNPEATAGQHVFLAKPCAACHTIRGTSAAGTNGPDLTHVGTRRYIAAGLFETTRGTLAAWIADPQTLKPGNNMPMVSLSSDELRAISAYMASLK